MLPAKSNPPQSSSQPSAAAVQDDDDFGLGFGSAPQPRPQAQSRPANDDFELAFDSLSVSRDKSGSSSAYVDPKSASHSLADHDPDDVLGELGRPPSRKPSPPQSHSRSSTPASSNRVPASSSSSPPPHVLGQLVEMGFNVPEAQQALAATYDAKQGTWDVQAAAEQILAIKVPDQDQPPSRPMSRTQRPSPLARPADTSAPTEDVLPPRSSGSPAFGGDQPLTKEQLVSQASALGNSMFKMANSYWKAGNKALKQAMDQRAAAQAQERAHAAPQDSRPKWMRDLPPDVQIDDLPEDVVRDRTAAQGKQRQRDHSDASDRGQSGPHQQGEPSLFDDDVLPPHPSERGKSSAFNASNIPSAQSSPAQPSAQPSSAPRVYQSSARRKIPQRSGGAASPASPQQAPQRTASSPRPPKPKVVYQRPKIPLPPPTLAASAQHRARGNEQFKLGAYADAEAAYTQAIEVLPEHHLATILPLNNRATARLKNGNERGSIEDCSVVLRLALCLTSPQVTAQNIDTAALDADSTALEVQGLNLREAVGKALSRRAQAQETAEKWQLALADWELLMQAGAPLVQPAGGSRIVSDGLTRCRKALAPKPSVPKKSAPMPKRPSPVSSQKDSEAVQNVRAAAQKAEADDAERLANKDAVDARIAAWKGGKENNLRALIASLDTVVWPELGWKSVGMHELITDNKLKINYTKAIAKLHPDKVRLFNLFYRTRFFINKSSISFNLKSS